MNKTEKNKSFSSCCERSKYIINEEKLDYKNCFRCKKTIICFKKKQ